MKREASHRHVSSCIREARPEAFVERLLGGEGGGFLGREGVQLGKMKWGVGVGVGVGGIRE